MKNTFRKLLVQEDLNFLLTNRVPRIALTRFMGWFSRIRNPWVCRASIAVWRLFTDLDLSDARTQRFASLHECFTRELRPGARAIDLDPQVLGSPCDAIVAVGSGTLNDLSKLAAGKRGVPQLVFGTAPSMNGYTSVSASVAEGGVKRSVRSRTPIGVFLDLGVLSAAPTPPGSLVGPHAALCRTRSPTTSSARAPGQVRGGWVIDSSRRPGSVPLGSSLHRASIAHNPGPSRFGGRG